VARTRDAVTRGQGGLGREGRALPEHRRLRAPNDRRLCPAAGNRGAAAAGRGGLGREGRAL